MDQSELDMRSKLIRFHEQLGDKYLEKPPRLGDFDKKKSGGRRGARASFG
jgi:hypothetical protein